MTDNNISTATVKDMGDGTVRVDHEGDKPQYFGPTDQRNGLDRTYAKAVASPYRLEGAIKIVKDGESLQARYENGYSGIRETIDPDDTDGTLKTMIRLVDTTAAVIGHVARRVGVNGHMLLILLADESQILCDPVKGVILHASPDGLNIRRADRFTPGGETETRRYGDDPILDSYVADLPGSVYTLIGLLDTIR